MEAYDAQMLALQRAAASAASATTPTTTAASSLKTSYTREHLCDKEFQLEELEV